MKFFGDEHDQQFYTYVFTHKGLIAILRVAHSVSDPDPIGSAFNLGLDPGSRFVF